MLLTYFMHNSCGEERSMFSVPDVQGGSSVQVLTSTVQRVPRGQGIIMETLCAEFQRRYSPASLLRHTNPESSELPECFLQSSSRFTDGSLLAIDSLWKTSELVSFDILLSLSERESQLHGLIVLHLPIGLAQIAPSAQSLKKARVSPKHSRYLVVFSFRHTYPG